MNVKAKPRTSLVDRIEQVLPRYVNGGCFSRHDVVSALVQPSWPFQRNAPALMQLHAASQSSSDKTTSGELQQVEVAPYTGTNAHVHRIIEWLRPAQDDLFGAYVHGSLGTYEEITYSDFDALVILKDDVFTTPDRLATTAQRLNRARAIMLDFDPLQHHGWFVLSEAQLKVYPEPYFPLALYRHAKSLLPDTGLRLKIHVQQTPREAWEAPFYALSAGIISSITHKGYPPNVYTLKGLLSRFMLLPALYVQARDQRSVFKKCSFDLAKADFSAEDWAVMDTISEIRANWAYELSAMQRWLLTRTSPAIRRVGKRFAPRIPATMQNALSVSMYDRMGCLACRMQERLQVA